MKTWPTTGKPWKGKEKEKRRQTETEPDQRRGERTEAPEPTYHGETYTNLGTRRNKPTWREENAGTHEIGDPWGTSWWIDASTTHAVFVIRLKALGFRVNPIDSCQCSTPELRAQLNLTNDHKKKKITTPADMSWNLTWSCVWNAELSSLSSSIEKGGCCRSFRLPSLEVQTQRWFPGTAGSSSTHDSTGWKLKQGQQFTLLRRITRLKTVNSDVVLLSTVSLERLSPRGSYHLDGTGMSDTLNQKHLTEFFGVECIVRAQTIQ